MLALGSTPLVRSYFARGLIAAATLLLACESSSPVDEGPAEAESEVVAEREAEPLPEALEHQVASYLEQYGRHWPEFRFHGTVLVARGEHIAVDQAFGTSDLVEDLPNETGTLFRVGTLSAQLTAAAVMRLVEAGELSLADPVSRHLPDWPDGSAITLEHLLAHRSGIPNFTDDLMFEVWKRGPRTLQDTMALFRGHPLEFEPGSDTSPSNSNYVVLGAILEAVAGKDYEQVVREQVLQPLSLEHTHYAMSDEPQAIGMAFHEDEYLEVVNRVHPAAFGSAGGWLSTSGDLLRLTQGIAHDQLLSRHGTMRMQGLTDDNLGYGWAPSEVLGHAAISWPGLIDGFNSAVLHIPEDDTTIIVLSNSEVIPAGQIVEDIAALAYGEESPRWEEAQVVPVPLEDQLYAVGRYVPTRGTEEAMAAAGADTSVIHEVFVRRVDDHLVFDVPGHARKHLHPLAPTRFFFKDGVQTRAELVTRVDQSPILVLRAGEGEVRFVRVDEPAKG